MEGARPRKVVYANGGQTKVTIIGNTVNMTSDERRAFFARALEAGEQWAVDINNTLCDLHDKRIEEYKSDRPISG